MGEAVEQRRRHFGVAEDGRPFAEAQVRRDDDAGALVELAEQMEEQRAAGGAERQVTEFVEDDEVGIGKPPSDLPRLSLKLFVFEGVDEFDGREEPDALAVMFDGLNADGGGEVFKLFWSQIRWERGAASWLNTQNFLPKILWQQLCEKSDCWQGQ